MLRIPWHRRLEARVAAGVTLIVAVSLLAALAVATQTVERRSLDRARSDLAAARSAFDHLVRSRASYATSQAQLILASAYFRAELDVVRAGTKDPREIADRADGYRQTIGAGFVVVTNHVGAWLRGSDASRDALIPAEALGDGVQRAIRGESNHDIALIQNKLFLIVFEPARFADEVLGVLALGYPLDDAVAANLAEVTRSEVTFVAGLTLIATSLAAGPRIELAGWLSGNAGALQAGPQTRLAISGIEYIADTFPLLPDRGAEHAGSLLLLQDWRPTQAFVDQLRTRLLWAGAGIFVLGLIGAFVFSRRLSQPLADIAGAAGDIAGGNWTRQVPVRGSAEAVTLATAFNDMSTGLRHWYNDAQDKSARLQQSQKMEAIGRLAGGVAHDFNNLLMAIRGYAEEVADSFTADDPRRADVTEILGAADRAAGLTRQLLAFSRRQTLAPRVLALEQVVAGTEKLLRRLIGEDVTLDSRTPPGLGCVRADPGQIEQVLVNLAVNARDAMPTGGTIRIELSNVELPSTAHGAVGDLPPGLYVCLALSDTGTGMSEDIRAHIFEPFFTTKEEGRGTGLGLATVYGIVQQSGGGIDVSSVLGEGTSFRIYLPRVDASAEPVVAVPRGLDSRGTETILLVEDDERVRALVGRTLRQHGYHVLAASTGEEALAVSRTHARTIALLLTDVVMPGISGRVLSEQLRVDRPELRVVFMSGYSPDAVERHGIEAGDALFIQKPFAMDVVAARVRQALDA